MGGRPGPRPHSADHAWRVAVRRRPSVAYDIHGNERDFAPLTALVAAALGGAVAPRRAPQRGRMVAAQRHGPGVPEPAAAVQNFHIITATPTCSSASSAAWRRAAAGDHDVPAAAVAALEGPPEGLLGVPSLSDVSWKQVLDAFVYRLRPLHRRRPATASGTPLAPRQVTSTSAIACATTRRSSGWQRFLGATLR